MNTVPLDFYDRDALLYRLSTGLQDQDRQVVFVVGSGLTAPEVPGGPGVPGVSEIINMIRSGFGADELQRLDTRLAGAQNPYQEAFRFLLGHRGPRAANGVIKRAVAKARKPLNASEGEPQPRYEISDTTTDEACRGFDLDSSGWNLTPAVHGLGRLATLPAGPFSRMIITTNFDPLIGASIGSLGGHSFRTLLHRDGSLSQSDGVGTHIVHLHGYWYGSDTLHTPLQLTQARPQLKASLSQLLRANTIVVMAYGAWDDAFTQALMSVALEDASYPEIVWCFFDDDPRLRPEMVDILEPGLSRGRVALYAGINVHYFLPDLADAWNAPTISIQPAAALEDFGEGRPERTDEAECAEAGAPDESAASVLMAAVIGEDSPPTIEFLVGRQREMVQLQSTPFHVGYITGFGGQGKSALAAAYFRSVEIGQKFSTRIWRDCREQSAKFEDQVSVLLEALGGGRVSASEIAKQQMADLAELFVQLTSTSPVFVVFDNVDHYVDLERRILTGAVGRFAERFLELETESRLLFTCRPRIATDSPRSLSLALTGLDLPAAHELFSLRQSGSTGDEIALAHEATNGHAFWLDLLAAQVARRAPNVRLNDLLLSIREGEGSIPDATLRSIWQSLRSREQVTLQALAEALRPTTLLELADYVRHEVNYKNLCRAISLLRDLNLVVLKNEGGSDAYELHPLINAFIKKTFPRGERVPFIDAILRTYLAFLAPYLRGDAKLFKSEHVRRCLEAAELYLNVGRLDEALERLSDTLFAVRRHEPPNEFVRIAQRLFSNTDISCIRGNRTFEEVYEAFVRGLSALGEIEDATEALEAYERTLDGKDSRYIHFCDMQCYLHWVNEDYVTAIRWGTEGEELRASGVDTRYSSTHNLALAQRDSGSIDPALMTFLNGVPLAHAIEPGKFDVDLGGAFYGNVGRCLHLMGQIDSAIACYRKSARLIEKDHDDAHTENQAYIRQWIGELLLLRKDNRSALLFLVAAAGKWSIVSPPKARKVAMTLRSTYGDEYLRVETGVAEAHVMQWIMKQKM